jgi:hypothetical protein
MGVICSPVSEVMGAEGEQKDDRQRHSDERQED